MSPPTTSSIAEPLVQARCPHCGTPVEAAADAYCCSGCALAAAIIRGAGLEQYYQERTAYAPRPEPLCADWSAIPVVQLADGSCETRLVVDNVRCASCVWLIERVLEACPGVEHVTVSYATGRTLIRWRPDVTSLAQLAERIARLGYRARALGAELAPDRSLLIKLGVAAFAALNLMLISAAIYSGWASGMDARFATLFRWVSLVLATPVALWCAAPFFTRAIGALRNRVLHIDLPIALGVTVLYAHGLAATLLNADAYFDSLGMLVALLLAGRMLESHGRRRAVEAAGALVASIPHVVRRVSNGRVELIPLAELKAGDHIDVPTGEELAADGVVVQGAGELRVALITGEAAPIAVAVGDAVLAGTLLVSGAITVAARAVGEHTVVHAMAAQLAAATERAARPSAADRVAPWFTAATLIAAALTFAAWLSLDGISEATLHTVAVLVVACPCALALAQPLAATAGLGAAARRGLLLRSPDALLDLAQVDVAALDKTGTLTEGELLVLDADDSVLRIAAGLERQSTHPIARAVLAEASARGIALPALAASMEIPGVGVSGLIDGQRWLLTRGPAPATVQLCDEHGRPAGTIVLGDALRADARALARALQADGVSVTLLTGDSAQVASVMARAAGIDDVAGGMRPDEKAAWVHAQRRAGRRVLFVGDGVNDGPALAAADVAIAMAGGAASSVLVADGVISNRSLMPILAGRRAARASLQAIRENQRRSIVYNVLAVGAAACGLVNPLVAAVLMPLSSGLVIWGSSRVEARVRALEAV
ncbi:MAG TPA: heavy metal translocating P-type ATPase metal-binding domain-containing protein [Longimicrobiales bacterium]